jgi:hypothetical protein
MPIQIERPAHVEIQEVGEHETLDSSWDGLDRHRTATFLSSGTVALEYRGLSHCRFCHIQNGSREFSDGTYLWPEGLAHYVKDHGVRLPEEFVRHATRAIDSLESADVDQDWWRSQG